MLAEAYSIVRGSREKEDASLDEFFKIAAPLTALCTSHRIVLSQCIHRHRHTGSTRVYVTGERGRISRIASDLTDHITIASQSSASFAAETPSTITTLASPNTECRCGRLQGLIEGQGCLVR